MPANPHEFFRLAAPSDAKRFEQIIELSSLPPAYIISQAWLRVEEEIKRSVVIPGTGPRTRVSVSPTRLLQIAVEQEFIADDELRLLDQLRALRNQAAHSLNPDISLTDALRYDDIANSLVQQVKERMKARGKRPDNS